MSIAIFIALIVALLVLRQSLVLVVAVAAVYVHLFLVDSKIEFLFQDIWLAIDREVLLPIPMFLLAGAIMTRGTIAERLIAIMVALTRPVRGGLGVAAILSCGVFAAISGSSVVTMLAVGSIMYPALVREGYSKEFALGALATGGTLGIIIPPSIALIVYGIITEVSVIQLFVAGFLPGLMLVTLLSGYAYVANRHLPAQVWDFGEIATAFRRGLLAMALPVILLGGIYSGFFTATESAVVAIAYALFVEVVIYREVGPRDLYEVSLDTAKLVGTLLPILAIAGSLNTILEFEDVPQDLANWIGSVIDNRWLLIVAINVLLLAVGCFMEVFSALLILSGILLPIVAAKGFDPVHFGIIMIINLEIGFLTPPVGLNLIVAMIAFKEPFGRIVRGVLPFLIIMLTGLALIVAFPQIALLPLQYMR
jgi:C4-dicarboxylate transporter DctM subunit